MPNRRSMTVCGDRLDRTELRDADIVVVGATPETMCRGVVVVRSRGKLKRKDFVHHEEQLMLKKKKLDDFRQELEQACKWLNIDRRRAREYVRLLEDFGQGRAIELPELNVYMATRPVHTCSRPARLGIADPASATNCTQLVCSPTFWSACQARILDFLLADGVVVGLPPCLISRLSVGPGSPHGGGEVVDARQVPSPMRSGGAGGGAQTAFPKSTTTLRMSVSLPTSTVRSGRRPSSAQEPGPVALDEEPDDGLPAARGVAYLGVTGCRR